MTMMRKGTWLLAGVLAFGILQTPHARAAAASGLEVSNGMCLLYCGEGQRPAAMVRVSAVKRDYETRGFFRLGVLPLEVAQGVVIEVYDRHSVAKCLSQCKRVLFGRGAKRTEVRQLELLVVGTTTNRVTCARARLESPEQWVLLGAVTVESGRGSIVAERGHLHVTGERAGELNLDLSPPRTLWLCNHEPTQGTQGTSKPIEGSSHEN
jgi:hypothetical protein